MKTESALLKMGLSEKSPTGEKNYRFLEKMWEQEKFQSFKDFLRLYNKRDVIRTLVATQELAKFYHNKGTDMLKLGCTLLKLANIFCTVLLVQNLILPQKPIKISFKNSERFV